jgi:hypothetical protein
MLSGRHHGKKEWIYTALGQHIVGNSNEIHHIQPGMVVHIYNPCFLAGDGRRIMNLKPAPAQAKLSKAKYLKRTGVWPKV